MMIRSSLSAWKAWCVLTLCFMMAACATPERIGAGDARGALGRTGRFALNVSYGDSKRDAVQGGFAWHDDGRRLILDLATPLGSTLARVEVFPSYAKLTRDDGSVQTAASPDELVELALGSPIPVAGLRDWLWGRTSAGAVQNVTRNEAGQIAGFSQNGWRVELSRYDEIGPRLLVLNRNEAGRHISGRLIVDSQ